MDWRLLIMLVWAAGVGILLAEMAAAWAGVRRMRRSAPRYAERNLVAALAGQLGNAHPVDVREAPDGTMPMTGGIFRSFVLIPSGAAEWTAECRRMVLLHELAHVLRGDVATQMVARAALILCWWNPLAWKAWREFVKERERAADDMVLNAGACASEYASGLLDVARSMKEGFATRWAVVTMARPSQLEGRLLAILDAGTNRKAVTRASALAAALAALALVLPLASVRAQSTQDAETQAMPADVDALIRTAAAQKDSAILENAARAAAELRKYDAAQKLMEAAAAIRSEVSGPQSADYGLDLLRLGNLQEKLGNRDAALTLYSRAAQILGNRPQASRALFYLGAAAITNKDFKQAMADFEQADKVDPSQEGVAHMWMAVEREQEQQPAEAAALFRRALSEQRPNSPEEVTTLKLFAQFLSAQGNTAEAGEMESRMAAARRIIEAEAHSQPTPAVTYRASSPGVQRPVLLSKVEPRYSDEARAAKLQGTEVLEVEIGSDGLVHNSRVIVGVGLGLDGNGVDAVNQWRFQPAMKDGQAVPVAATIEVNFRLM